jgi:hypothetical protein
MYVHILVVRILAKERLIEQRSTPSQTPVGHYPEHAAESQDVQFPAVGRRDP